MLLDWKKTPGLRLVILSAIAFFLFTLVFTLHRHFSFYSSYDQGIFNQVFWNNLHGRFFQSSLSSQLSTNVVHTGDVPEVFYHRLGQHFTPALLLWLPIYALFPNPATLTVLQVTLMTAAGIVLYILARHYLEPMVAAMITVSYYGANAILGPTLANFHDICQIPLFTFTLLLALERRWWWVFGIFAVLILAVREDSGIGLFGVGVYLILSKRYPRLGIGVCLGSFLYLVGLTNFIMPLFSDDISKRFMLERFGQYTTAEEASTWDIIVAIATNPLLVIREIFTPFFGTLRYLIGQWLPFAFIPAISPASWCIAGFPLLKLLIGKGQSVLAINIRYAITVVPGLCYGAILWWAGQGFRNFREKVEYLEPRRLSLKFQRFWIGLICVSLLFTIISSPNRTFYFIFPDSYQPLVYVSPFRQWQRSGDIRAMIAQIPPDASVSATTYIIPHLSGRREIIRLPGLQLRNDEREVINVDYILADLWQLERYQVAFREDRGVLVRVTSVLDQVIDLGQYGVIDFKEGVVLLKRASPSNLDAKQEWFNYRREIQL
jgi:uncharacterized membrane protein